MPNQMSSKIQFQFCSKWRRRKYWRTQILGKHRSACILVPENGVICDDIKCYAYQTLGQYADQCLGQTETNFANTGIMLSQVQHIIENTWILLDT